MAQKDKTCFKHGELKLLAKEFNKQSAKKIKIGPKKKMVNDLLKSFQGVCSDNQYCWIKQIIKDVGKKVELEKAFRPEKPTTWKMDRHTWLNTYDILYVMKQYEELYKDFVFLNVVPRDFASRENGTCIGDMLCDFDVRKLDKKRFGIVFNTDDSHHGGMHWNALFCNLDNKKVNYGVYFYDSVGDKAMPEVRAFMKKIVDQVGDKDFEMKENKIQKQFGNSECGMFSIVFLTQCLKNIKFDLICKRMPTDAEINRIRDVLFTS